MPILEVEHISKSFGGTEVLKDISFSLEKSQVLSIIGSSGSGKTTLLKHMIKSQIPIGIGSGSMYFAGADIETMDDRVAASQIAYVGQDPEHNMVTDYVWQERVYEYVAPSALHIHNA